MVSGIQEDIVVEEIVEFLHLDPQVTGNEFCSMLGHSLSIGDLIASAQSDIVLLTRTHLLQ